MKNIITETITFPGSLGHKLVAKIDRPEEEPWGIGIFSPCFTCTKDILAASRICKYLAEQGLSLLRLDFTGQGNSEGSFAQTNFSTNVNDLLKAIEFLSLKSQTPTFLMGHSLGGTAALVAASRNSTIKAVVTLNSPCHPLHVSRHFKDQESLLEKQGDIDITVAGKAYKIERQFLEDLKTYHMPTVLKQLKAALLIIHTPEDKEVLIQNAKELFALAHHPKSFIGLNDSDHMITNKHDALYIAQTVATWLSRYIEPNSSLKP